MWLYLPPSTIALCVKELIGVGVFRLVGNVNWSEQIGREDTFHIIPFVLEYKTNNPLSFQFSEPAALLSRVDLNTVE